MNKVPSRTTCFICNKNIRERYHAVKCDRCKLRAHWKCVPSVQGVNQRNKNDYTCYNCLGIVPDSDDDDKEDDKEELESRKSMSKEKQARLFHKDLEELHLAKSIFHSFKAARMAGIKRARKSGREADVRVVFNAMFETYCETIDPRDGERLREKRARLEETSEDVNEEQPIYNAMVNSLHFLRYVVLQFVVNRRAFKLYDGLAHLHYEYDYNYPNRWKKVKPSNDDRLANSTSLTMFITKALKFHNTTLDQLEPLKMEPGHTILDRAVVQEGAKIRGCRKYVERYHGDDVPVSWNKNEHEGMEEEELQ
jgi:hypothetical protein